MARFNITYGIVGDNTVLATDTLSVTINKKDLALIEQQLIDNNHSPLLAQLPPAVYEKICSRALAAGPALCQKSGITFTPELAVAFSQVLPVELLPLLDPAVAEPLKANMQAILPELFD